MNELKSTLNKKIWRKEYLALMHGIVPDGLRDGSGWCAWRVGAVFVKVVGVDRRAYLTVPSTKKV